MDRPVPPYDLGPDLKTPVVAVDFDLVAQIAGDDWLMVGAPATVWRDPKHGPWDGKVVGYGRAFRSQVEWPLASGELSGAPMWSKSTDGFVVGHTFELNQRGRMRQASIVECVHATRVTIAYTIQSGATKRRDFYRLGELNVYARPGDGDMNEVVALGPLPATEL